MSHYINVGVDSNEISWQTKAQESSRTALSGLNILSKELDNTDTLANGP